MAQPGSAGSAGGGPVPAEASRADPRGAQPLRPLTFGELLDTAIALLRGHFAIFLVVGATLAVAEQAILYPLRQAAGATPPSYWYLPHADRLGAYWLLLAAGLATEMTAIALLGGLTARAAGHSLLARRLPARRLLALDGSRAGAVVVVAVCAGIVTGICALAGLLPWVLGYGLLGLAVPAVVIDRRAAGPAMVRSLVLSARIGLRACWIRIAGYLGWSAIRLALAIGGPAALYQFLGGQERWFPFVLMATAAAVNAAAYPALACLDAVLHLETRMRTEGLDITLARATRTDTADVALLARAVP